MCEEPVHFPFVLLVGTELIAHDLFENVITKYYLSNKHIINNIASAHISIRRTNILEIIQI